MTGNFRGILQLCDGEEFPDLDESAIHMHRGKSFAADAEMVVGDIHGTFVGIQGYAFQIARICHEALWELSHPTQPSSIEPGYGSVHHMRDVTERYSLPEPPTLPDNVLRQIGEYVSELLAWDEELKRRRMGDV